VLFDREKQLSALRALWKYNFVPDVGPFREKFRLGRWYAMAGDAGLLMCTWPKGGHRKEWMQHWQYMYFNECMTGFEWQVAAHMIHEGMVQEGLAVSRAIHDRYAPALRNPYNEIECSDHYSRAMASYGTFLSACGYEYHGPKGHLGFAPRLTPERFRAPFTAAEGWGTFQQVLGVNPRYRIMVKWGKLRLKTLALQARTAPRSLTLTLAGRRLAATHTFKDGRILITLTDDAVIDAGQTLDVQG
jgi:non-lysosomal glucosylceramidase